MCVFANALFVCQTDGAAIYMTGSGNFMDCEFMSNKASSGSGGAIMQANESAAESFVVRYHRCVQSLAVKLRRGDMSCAADFGGRLGLVSSTQHPVQLTVCNPDLYPAAHTPQL